MRAALHLILLIGYLSPLLAQTPDPRRFEKSIRAFEHADSLNPPARGQIVLYGSSTFVLWKTYKEDLSGYSVLNRGFGGSNMTDALHYFDRVLLPLQPSWILLYEGDNDLLGRSVDSVFADYRTFAKRVFEKMPHTRVAFYSVKPSVARIHLLDKQQALNRLLAQYARKHRRKLAFIDTATPLLGPDGKPTTDRLIGDQLHLNGAGYAIWTQVTRDFLGKRLKKGR